MYANQRGTKDIGIYRANVLEGVVWIAAADSFQPISNAFKKDRVKNTDERNQRARMQRLMNVDEA